MRIDSTNPTFSFQNDFSFQAFLEHGKKAASQKQLAREQANKLSDDSTDLSDLSFQTFLNQGKKIVAQNESANGELDNPSHNPSNNLANNPTNEAANEASRAQLYSQFQTGQLDVKNPQDKEPKSNKNIDKNTNFSFNTANSPSVFKMGGISKPQAQNAVSQTLSIGHIVDNKAAKAFNQVSENGGVVASQLQQVQASGGSNSGITAGSRVSHGTTMSVQM